MTVEQKKLTNMTSMLLWNYFIDYLKVIVANNNILNADGSVLILQDAIEEDLTDKGFTRDEIIKAYSVYSLNLMGLDIAQIIDFELMYKLCAYFISLENSELSESEFIDTIHKYDINITDQEGKRIYDAYLNFDEL